MDRILTGIKDVSGKSIFDEALGGGIPSGDSILVAGKTGTCKTTFVSQILNHNSLNEKKNCVYISLEQPDWKMTRQMAQYGINFNKTQHLHLVYLDLYKDDILRREQIMKMNKTLEDLGNLKYTSPEKKSKVLEKETKIREEIKAIKSQCTPVVDQLLEMVEHNSADIVAVDSLDAMATEILDQITYDMPYDIAEIQEGLSLVPKSEERLKRKEIRRILAAFGSQKMTSFLISEQPEDSEALSRDGVSDFMTDGVIVLYHVGMGVEDFRSIKIRKLRESNHVKDFILFKIGKNGIEITEDPLKKAKKEKLGQFD